MTTPGMHHVTAFASSPQGNMDFYTGVLGLRRIKIAVNYDDPGTYHLYYADRVGTPGTVMTFFPHPDAKPGRNGYGQASAVAFSVPVGSIDFWTGRLAEACVDVTETERFSEPCITFTDPDGLPLELIGVGDHPGNSQPWATDEVPAEVAIAGFHSVLLKVRNARPTIEFIEKALGFHITQTAGAVTRMQSDSAGIASLVDIEQAADDSPRGSFGPGTIHHIAWRVSDEDELEQMRQAIDSRGINVTEIKNRNYFRSIYFREPGGVVFEIATDGPGFTIDESVDELGAGLMLPPWLEPQRDQIEADLPPLDY